MTRRPLTELQQQLIDCAHQRDSGRGVIYGVSPEAHAMAQAFAAGAAENPPKIEVAPSRRAAARRAKNKPSTWTDKLDVEGIWEKWNAPRAVAQDTPNQRSKVRQVGEAGEAADRFTAEQDDLQKAAPVLDADEIYRHWNKRPQPAEQEG